MIHEELRLCGPQGQPCTRNCGIDCHWNTAETPHDIAARHFWGPGLQYETSLNDDMRVPSFPSLRQWAEDMGRSFFGSLGWVALFSVCVFVGVVALK